MGLLKQKGFYKPGTKEIRDDLFNEFAEKVAGTFAEVSQGETEEQRNGVTSTQIRRLFDEVKRYERLLTDEKSWTDYKPYIKMIKSKVRYTVARAIKKASNADVKYYKNLSEFISDGIDLINDKKDFQVFVSLFEAVYGFYYENRPDLKN